MAKIPNYLTITAEWWNRTDTYRELPDDLIFEQRDGHIHWSFTDLGERHADSAKIPGYWPGVDPVENVIRAAKMYVEQTCCLRRMRQAEPTLAHLCDANLHDLLGDRGLMARLQEAEAGLSIQFAVVDESGRALSLGKNATSAMLGLMREMGLDPNAGSAVPIVDVTPEGEH